jgi:hypothetical protein
MLTDANGMILKYTLKTGFDGVVRIMWRPQGTVASSCEHTDEPLGSTTANNFAICRTTISFSRTLFHGISYMNCATDTETDENIRELELRHSKLGSENGKVRGNNGG